MLAINDVVAVEPCGAGCSLGLSDGVLTLAAETEPGDCAQNCKLDNVISILDGQGLSSDGLVFGSDAAKVIDYMPLLNRAIELAAPANRPLHVVVKQRPQSPWPAERLEPGRDRRLGRGGCAYGSWTHG